MCILGKLAPFSRIKIVVESVRRVPDKQHIMATPKYRLFEESIFVSGKKNGGKYDICVPFSIHCGRSS